MIDPVIIGKAMLYNVDCMEYMVGCELDVDYFNAGCERCKQAMAQLRMFA